MKKIDLGVVVTTLIIVTISCSLAFFAARIVGNPKDINLVAKNVAIMFTDTSSIADETISPGWNNVKTFTITNNSKEDFNYNIILKGLVNTFESINTLQYKITSDTGYNMDNYLNIVKTENSKDVVLAYDVVIPKGSKQTYQVEFKYISIDEDQSSDMGKKLGGTLAIEESTGKPKIYDKLLADNPTIKTRTDFSTTLTETNVNILYKAKENSTDVYYFAGDARNNWVKFGGYYWRIIRTNSDGSVRLLYHGTSTTATDAYIKSDVKHKFCWSENSQGVCQNDDPMYVGYMYGISGSLENNRLNTNNSTIKIAIDTWYKDNMIPYTKYLSTTAIYCNDRSIVSGQYNLGNSTFTFGAQYRLQQNNVPSYDCGSDAKGSWFDTKQSSSDMFTTPNLNNVGNGKLTYPIALITADELVYAGGKMYANALNYIYYNSNNKSSTGVESIWTMTPISWFESAAVSFANTGSDNPGYLGIGSVNYSGSLRPVISIKKDLIYKSGDGSAENPYIIEAVPVNTYEVNLNVNSGSGTGTVLVEAGKDAKFTVAPNSGYKAELETNTCGGTLVGNSYTISNITSNKTCSISFKKNGTSLATLIRANAVNENGYRYEGSNPNNYIYMVKNGSNELWRIIGLFPDGENGEDVIRVRKVGYSSAAYHSSSDPYINHWPNTTLYSILSSTYSATNYKNTIQFKVYLGAANDGSVTASEAYSFERGSTPGATAKSSYSSATTAIVSVALMYPSDYGYGVLASDCARTKKLGYLSYNSYSECYNNNWLYQGSSSFQWLISPDDSYAGYEFVVHNSGYVNPYYRFDSYVNTSGYYAPVMALSSSVYVTGSGTQSDPYVMN